MKRKLVFGTFMAVVLAAIVSVACVTPAFAVTTLIDHQSTCGFAYIDVPGHNTAVITFAHFDWGDNGVGDSIGIWKLGPAGLFPVAFFRDSESTYNWAKELYKGTPVLVQLVKCYQLQVYGTDKIAIAIWTFPIVVPEETWVIPGYGKIVFPAVTIPPGCLILKGYDGLKTGTEVMPTPPSGWATTMDWTGFDAHATLVCPSWHYCGSVGLGQICWVHEMTLTQTHP